MGDRHVTVLESDAGEGDYLTMHVYADTQGRRVYYPDKPMFRGIYTNNPHTLVRYDVYNVIFGVICLVYLFLSCTGKGINANFLSPALVVVFMSTLLRSYSRIRLLIFGKLSSLLQGHLRTVVV